MSNNIAVVNNAKVSTEPPLATANKPCDRPNGAADPHNQRSLTREAHASADGFSLTPKPKALLPLGYRLVTVQIQGQNKPAVQDLPVEVLPCHTFLDLCTVALARLPDAPGEYGLQAFIAVRDLEVPLEHPYTPAHDTLRSFSTAASLRFLLDLTVPGAERAGVGRVVRVSRMTTAPRRQRGWLRQLARVAVGVAKFVLAVEAAALLRGGIVCGLRRLTGRDVSDSIALGSGTEAVMDAVADYVGGRGDLRVLERFDPRVVRRALEALDTEVLEQMDVPDVQSTRTAVSEVLRQIRGKEQAATTPPPGHAQAGSASTPDIDDALDAAAQAGKPAATSTTNSEGQRVLDGPTAGSSIDSSSGPSAGAGEDSVAFTRSTASSSGLPGFGPSSSAAAPGGARTSRAPGRGAGA